MSKRQNPMRPLAIVSMPLKSTFRRMWPLFALLLLTTLGSMLAELAPPLVLRSILDEHLKVNMANGLTRLAVFYLGALIVSSTLGFAQTMVTTTIGQNVLLDLRLLMARHLSTLPMRYYNTTPVGETMSRLTSDVEAVDALFSAGLINAITNLFKVVGIVVAMVAIDPLMTLITVAFAPVLYYFSGFFRRGMYRAQMGVRRSVAEINTFLQETFAGMRTLKSFGQEEAIKDRFERPLQGNMEARNHEAVYIAWFPCVLQVIRAIAIALVAIVGAKTRGLAGVGLTVGGMAAFLDLMGRMFGPIESLAQEFQTIQRAMAGLERIAGLLNTPQEERGPTISLNGDDDFKSENVIVAQEIGFGYIEGQSVLSGTSLTVPRGAKVALVGRTGAGKTTLMNLMAGLFRPAEGSVRICGHDPHRVDPASRRKLLGIVPQGMHLFEGTVAENITLRDTTISQKDIERACKTVGLHETILAMPEGYASPLGEAGAKLSYGETQLVALARAIVTDPPLLLLDEPTSGLDAITEKTVYDAFRAASANRTILTISHRLSGVLDADVVHIMANGRIVQSGAPDDLAQGEGWYSMFKQLEDLGWEMG